ncbi:MAG: OmpA family protein [Brevinematia bacterium]
MKKGLFLLLYVCTCIFTPHSFANQLSVNYVWYNWNEVYKDSPVNISYDFNFVISSEETKRFPSLYDPPKTLPAFLSVKITSPSPTPESREETKKDVITETKEPARTKRIVVYFPFNKSSLVSDQKRYLISEVKSYMETFSSNSIKAEIRGYACPLGKRTYNKKLSTERAKNVARILESLGVKVVKIEGLGETEKSKILCLDRYVEVILKIEE